VKPFVLPFIETMGRRVLVRQGVESRHVETPHGHLHVYDARGRGSLPTVVLLHGLGSSATAFGRVLLHLRRGVRRVLGIELPGHGFSTGGEALTPEILFGSVQSALGRLDLGPALLVGNSLGGAVALRCAIDAPGLVRGLVLVSPAGARATAEDWQTVRGRFDVRTRTEGRAFLERLYSTNPWALSVFAHEMPALLSRPAVRGILESAADEHLPSPAQLAALSMPILLLWGQRERILPESHLAYFTRHLPKHTRFERPPRYAHCPHLDHPSDLARRVVSFASAMGPE
jgi:pimeloyl-ACP methyl ester carboxylesterase